ncbi:Uncharacterised protein [Mycobacteroides abscessus subsp. abscessus]|nr:Uncharacterised protein [Mycobacteroides abscessus subsp. abscessus]
MLFGEVKPSVYLAAQFDGDAQEGAHGRVIWRESDGCGMAPDIGQS